MCRDIQRRLCIFLTFFCRYCRAKNDDESAEIDMDMFSHHEKERKERERRCGRYMCFVLVLSGSISVVNVVFFFFSLDNECCIESDAFWRDLKPSFLLWAHSSSSISSLEIVNKLTNFSLVLLSAQMTRIHSSMFIESIFLLLLLPAIRETRFSSSLTQCAEGNSSPSLRSMICILDSCAYHPIDWQ